MRLRWQLPAASEPCPVCLSERIAHSCPLSLAQPVWLAVTVTDAGTFAAAIPCAFARALRDA